MTYRPRRSTENDLQEVTTRHRAVRDLLGQLAAGQRADIWQTLAAAFADIPALSAEVARLRDDLADARLDRANLAAAALAVITAHADGEPDPLSYLRDELRAQGHDLNWGRR